MELVICFVSYMMWDLQLPPTSITLCFMELVSYFVSYMMWNLQLPPTLITLSVNAF